eukprot:CAMPEP_0174234286 /NCGR_PEP_ID=MMETSP0417-20130205/4087_1 /TAXON_ID=242541 /ORGANISM="Mayorella sp, Strain BSH-02190019" /LENGTH=376 /DNA_ID=CAMNT_0015312631 /DNA_START=211 /DNA_END=1338 /DNA_ORIENTATION=+
MLHRTSLLSRSVLGLRSSLQQRRFLSASTPNRSSVSEEEEKVTDAEADAETKDLEEGSDAVTEDSEEAEPRLTKEDIMREIAVLDSRLYSSVKRANETFLEGQVLLSTMMSQRIAQTFGPRLHQKTREAIFYLHTVDPEKWTFNKLASRFRVRADRVEAVYRLMKSQKEQEAAGAVFDYELDRRVDEVCGTSLFLESDRTLLEPTAPKRPQYRFVEEELSADVLEKEFKHGARIGRRRPLPYHEMLEPPETADPGGKLLPFDAGESHTRRLVVDISGIGSSSWTGLNTPMAMIEKDGRVMTPYWEDRRRVLQYLKPTTYQGTQEHSALLHKNPPTAVESPTWFDDDPDYYVNVNNTRALESEYRHHKRGKTNFADW